MSKKVQEITDRISRGRQKLLESISNLSEAQLNDKSEGSAWSICDIVHHLALTDEANAKLMFNLLKRARAENLQPDPSPDGSELHSADEVFTRMAEPKFQAPKFVEPQSHLPVEESLARLKASRANMLEAVDQLAEYDLSQLTFPHPFAGPLNAYQWMLMAGMHEYRHTEQINRIKAQSGFPM
ncbi:MAG: DinB family protein [Blastocatellia bacterium]